MRPESASKLLQIGRKLENWQWRHNFWHEVIVKFFWLCFFSFAKFSYWSKFHVNISDSPEIRKSEKKPSKFCPISGDWGESRISSLARTSLIKCYWILKNARVTAFTVSELLRENQQRGKITPPPKVATHPG